MWPVATVLDSAMLGSPDALQVEWDFIENVNCVTV